MTEYALAPDAMFAKVAAGDTIAATRRDEDGLLFESLGSAYYNVPDPVSFIQEMHDRMAEQIAGTAKSGLCRRCQTPFGEWDTLHPLFRSWSQKCPGCHTRDIQLDFAHQNQED